MCRLIYKVLTPGPERISILLGKCFPLGLLSATAYRCFRRTVKAVLFPPRHERKKNHLLGSRFSQTRTDLQLRRECIVLSPACMATGSSDAGMFTAASLGLECTLFAADLSGWQPSSNRCTNRNQTTLHGSVSGEYARNTPPILTNVLGDRTKMLLRRAGTHKSQKLQKKHRFTVVYKGSRGPSDCSVCSAQALTPIYQSNSSGRGGRQGKMLLSAGQINPLQR